MENQNTRPVHDDEIEISLYDIAAAVFRKKFMICVIVAAALALALTYLYFADPVYESSATVMVSSLSNDSSDSLSSLLNGFGGSAGSEITTEVTLLTSRLTVQDALDRLDLSRYTGPDGVAYSDLEDPMTAQGLIAGDVISVTNVTDTNIVLITVRDTNAQFAADLANAVAEAFNTVLTGFARSGSTASIDFVNSQIPIAMAEAERASQALADFQRENSVLQATTESELALTRYNYLESRRAPLSLEEQEADAILAAATFGPGYDELMADASVQSLTAELSSTQKEILSYDLMSLVTGVSANGASTGTAMVPAGQSERYYTLVNRQQTIERSLEQLIVSMIPGQSALDASTYASAMVQKISARSQIDLIDEQSALESATLETVPELQMQLARLQSDVEVYQTMVVTLMQMGQEAQLRDAAIDDNVVPIDQALVSERPVSPNKLMVLAVAVVLGGFIGVGIALLLELNDKSIFSSDDLRKTLPDDVPFLGWLPMLKATRNHRYVSSVVNSNPNSFESEKYKLLASNLIFGRGGNNRVITVCSTDKNEGKTSVMANVAIALTQNGYEVLLVDGDLRMPSCEQYFNLEHQERGLVDVVMDGVDLDSCIVQPLENVSKLNLLPRGSSPAIPSMVYSSENFSSLIALLKKRYDIILFDAPPLSFASELLALAKNAPEILIVTRAGITNKSVLVEMIENFRTCGVTVVGACLNAVIISHGSGKSGYGSYSYSYASKDPTAMASVIKRVPWFSSRKMYYRRRYKRDERYRMKHGSPGKRVRPTHPYKPELDIS